MEWINDYSWLITFGVCKGSTLSSNFNSIFLRILISKETKIQIIYFFLCTAIYWKYFRLLLKTCWFLIASLWNKYFIEDSFFSSEAFEYILRYSTSFKEKNFICAICLWAWTIIQSTTNFCAAAFNFIFIWDKCITSHQT